MVMLISTQTRQVVCLGSSARLERYMGHGMERFGDFATCAYGWTGTPALFFSGKYFLDCGTPTCVLETIAKLLLPMEVFRVLVSGVRVWTAEGTRVRDAYEKAAAEYLQSVGAI